LLATCFWGWAGGGASPQAPPAHAGPVGREGRGGGKGRVTQTVSQLVTSWWATSQGHGACMHSDTSQHICRPLLRIAAAQTQCAWVKTKYFPKQVSTEQ
jgi:hypothetical protein